jgi:hypothetical protein
MAACSLQMGDEILTTLAREGYSVKRRAGNLCA